MGLDNHTLQNLRQDYRSATLAEGDITNDPLKQFEKWFQEAINAQVLEPNAMTLATASESGAPSARIVLLKEISEGGFVFYTNYNSRKGSELSQNPNAALVFFWPDLERQIRVEGKIVKVTEQESISYFKSRPKGSQLGAIVSPQSTIIPNRKYLEDRLHELNIEFEAKEIPKPEHWGGYRVIPHQIEFWQGRRNRLHDRIVYVKTKDNWDVERLAP